MQPSLTGVVFGNERSSAVVFVDGNVPESVAAQYAAQGMRYAGYVSVVNGKVEVHTEPGCEAIMACGAVVFAERLGTRLKELQLAASAEV